MKRLCHHSLPNQRFDLLQLHQQHTHDFPFFLQSVARGTPQARYDILMALPSHTITLDSKGQLHSSLDTDSDTFLTALDQVWQAERFEHMPIDLPFQCGWFVYLGYELAGEIEPRLNLPSAPGCLPTALAVRIPAAIIYDHEQDSTHLLAETEAQLQQLQQALKALNEHPFAPDHHSSVFDIEEEDVARHLQGVARIKQYIVDGDVFQVNLSRLWQASVKPGVDASRLYRRLCSSNPAPFAGLMQWQGAAVISSSPERLVSVRQGRVETRPIAGTRKRAKDQHEDHALSEELLAHPKERAEHIMLLDLERNDLGRIAQPGSVKVDEMMVLESYAHVHHIVSNVTAKLRPEITPGEVIRAVFPGGTITGCPKVRCMEILAELEAEGRGAYTGSMGYLNHSGDMDLNILIRTMELCDNRLYWRAGGGIVADSDADKELQETRAKAKGLLMSLQVEGEN